MSELTAMTLRLPREQAEDLALIAGCDGESVTDAIRAAVAAWIERRRQDPNVQEALRRIVSKAERLASVSSDVGDAPPLPGPGRPVQLLLKENSQ